VERAKGVFSTGALDIDTVWLELKCVTTAVQVQYLVVRFPEVGPTVLELVEVDAVLAVDVVALLPVDVEVDVVVPLVVVVVEELVVDVGLLVEVDVEVEVEVEVEVALFDVEDGDEEVEEVVELEDTEDVPCDVTKVHPGSQIPAFTEHEVPEHDTPHVPADPMVQVTETTCWLGFKNWRWTASLATPTVLTCRVFPLTAMDVKRW
jgi:hypothetical protein